ncbi:MAG: fluoride efflux transporter CrcB [Candidatus Cloacimonadota bacterium]|nr:MAG: fluoride efflux transporter CrcB [Candidatus Cloacimonadota bacterium]
MLYIALGGSVGAVSRFLMSQLINRTSNDIFPWGTIAVNLLGSLLIGFFVELFSRTVVPDNLRSILIIGFLGAFTTFSTYALESISLLRGNEIKLFIQNILIHNVLGLVFVIFGIYLSRIVIKYIFQGMI